MKYQGSSSFRTESIYRCWRKVIELINRKGRVWIHTASVTEIHIAEFEFEQIGYLITLQINSVGPQLDCNYCIWFSKYLVC